MDGLEASVSGAQGAALTTTETMAPDDAGVDLSVLILSYNVKSFLELALKTALDACRSIRAEIVVVDNASGDGSADMVDDGFVDDGGDRGTPVRLIRSPRNVGFSAGNNLGIEVARGRYVLLLNPDVVVHQSAFETLLAHMDEHSDVGAIGGMITNPDGTKDPRARRGTPSPSAAIYHMTGLSHIFPRSPRFGKYKLTYLDDEHAVEVEALSGCFMCVRREAIDQVGMLDEAFFMYGEDLDWSYRIRAAGWKIVYEPAAEIVHFGGESTRTLPKLRQLYEFHRAMRIFVRKHLAEQRSKPVVALIELGIVVRGVGTYLWRLARAAAIPVFDLLLLAASLAAAFGVRTLTGWVVPDFHLRDWALIGAVFVGAGSVGVLLTSLYGGERSSGARALVAAAIGGAVCVVAIFFIKTINFSRIVTGLTWAFAGLLAAAWRSAIYRRAPRPENRVLVLGCGEKAAALLSMLAASTGSSARRCQIVGLIRGSDDPAGGAAVGGYPVLGDLSDLPLLLRRLKVDELFVAWEHYRYSDVLSLTRRGRGPRRIRLIPDDVAEGSGQSPEDWPLINLDREDGGIWAK